MLDGIRLVATDLDGTLLYNHRSSVDPEAFPIIERFCDAGGFFFAASGRQYASLQLLFDPIKDHVGYICENGGLIMLCGDVIACQNMDRGLMLEVCKLAESIPGCSYVASGIKSSYAPANKTAFIAHLVNEVGNRVTPVVKPEDIPEDIIKVAFQVEDPGHIEETRLVFEEVFSKDCRVVTSGTTWIDVMEYGINKGSALKALSRAIGVSVNDMAAFGDAENDREMLELVGHPYLMDPCYESMLDIMKRPCAKRCTRVETEIQRIIGEL